MSNVCIVISAMVALLVITVDCSPHAKLTKRSSGWGHSFSYERGSPKGIKLMYF